ncbi:hypothetical protein SLE2022_119800 [Rubroshorea leprosula]
MNFINDNKNPVLKEKSESHSSGQDGSAFAIEPTTTSMGGKIACNPRAITVLVVPRLPDIAIPPISRSIVFRMKWNPHFERQRVRHWWIPQ